MSSDMITESLKLFIACDCMDQLEPVNEIYTKPWTQSLVQVISGVI